MPEPRGKSFNYAIGMFGTSIPINMLKTFAFTFYVLGLGVTTEQWAAMLLIYTFIDALDNPSMASSPTGRGLAGAGAVPG